MHRPPDKVFSREILSLFQPQYPQQRIDDSVLDQRQRAVVAMRSHEVAGEISVVGSFLQLGLKIRRVIVGKAHFPALPLGRPSYCFIPITGIRRDRATVSQLPYDRRESGDHQLLC
ncbi:hypothetical protein D3C76_1569120 [compost metagenome]